jgi:hypothetical protein
METQTRETPQATQTERSRWWLVALVVLGLAAIGGAIWAISNSGGDDALPGVLEEWEESMEAGDGDAMAALYTEDGVHYDLPLTITLNGRNAINRGMNETFMIVVSDH